jgi:hypothetical protein
MPSKKPPNDSNQQPTDEASQLPLDLGALISAEPAEKPTRSRKKDSALKSPGRIERVTSRDEFESAIRALGGDDQAISFATGAIYRVAFNMTAAQLYRRHSAPSNNRDFLPLVVQRIIQVHELINAEMLRNHTLPPRLEEQSDINNHIVVIVRKQTQQTEVFLATFKLFGKGAQLGQRKPSLVERSPITVDTEYGPIEVPVLEVENDEDIPF